MIDSGARASESVASSAVSRALTVAVADVCAEWPHTEHGATSAADVRTTVNALADNVRQALSGDAVRLVAFPPFVPVRRTLELLRRAFLERTESPEMVNPLPRGNGCVRSMVPEATCPDWTAAAVNG